MTSEATAPAPMIASPDDIDREFANRAFSGTSFSPEQRGQARRDAYAADVNELYAELWQLAKTPEQKELLAHEMEQYKRGYIGHLNAYLQSHSSVVSPMIAGPSNFPVRRMEKRNRWADNKAREFTEWRTKAREAIKRKILAARPEEEKQAAAWRALEFEIDGTLGTIKAIDESQSSYNRSSFVNSIVGKVERLAMNGEVALVTKAMELVTRYNANHKKPAISARHKFWLFGDLAKKKAQEHDGRLDQETKTAFEMEGLRIFLNYGIDRVQIEFDAKPSPKIIGKLKSEGWHWSPTEGMWQRKLTDAAKLSSQRIAGEFFDERGAKVN